MQRSLIFHFLRWSMGFSALLVLSCIATLVFFLLSKGWPAWNTQLFFGNTNPIDAILGRAPLWQGIWSAFMGTLCLIAATMALVLLPGIGCGIFLAEYASPAWSKRMSTAIDLLAGAPSIVMGLFGFTLILFLRRTFLPDANTCLLLAAGCLSLLVTPVLVVNTREALEAVPRSIKLAAASLGFSKNQIVFRVALPMAVGGIVSGAILAMGRSAEDTAVIMLTGAVANAGLPSSLLAKFEALPFTIYYTMAHYQTQEELNLAFGAALLLLLLATIMVILAKGLELGHQYFWQGEVPSALQ